MLFLMTFESLTIRKKKIITIISVISIISLLFLTVVQKILNLNKEKTTANSQNLEKDIEIIDLDEPNPTNHPTKKALFVK